MKRAGLSRITPTVLNLLRPSIRLIIGEQSEQPVTRLGGTPNMPENITWPTRKSGDPHSFLAQLDLAELGTCDGVPLPSRGSLFFFCDAEYLPERSDPDDVKDGIKVIYSSTSLSENVLRTPPGLNEEYVFKSYSLKPTPDLTAPAQDLWEIECLDLSDAESSAYGELFAQVCANDGSIHRIGGYPNQVQFNQLTGTDDAGATDWRLLLQLDSENDAGMMWGDLGKLYFMIREHDLKSLSFEKTWMDWQCG
ncbi:MAG TPA: YwqG family protein [Terracidiphilus sp.]|nr:YwqG family protein [Terracidiphilus sp.]